jgi:transposase
MIPAGTRIFACTEPIDMRRSFDGLALAVRDRIGCDPQQGGLYIFTNKRRNRLKLLWFDQNGYCILYKRLHRAVFALPKGEGASVTIAGAQLAELLRGAEVQARDTRRDRC